MSSAISISTLLTSPRPDAAPVAFAAGGTHDWASFKGHLSSLAARLERAGGARWLIASEDAYAQAVGLFATLHAGGTAYLPANLQTGHLAALADGVDGVLAHGNSRFSEAGALPILAQASDAPHRPLAPLDAEAATIVLHTSGTTGTPKALPKALRCLEAEVATLEQVFGSLCSETVLATVPPYHIYGLLFRVLWPLAAGRPFAGDTIRFPTDLSAELRKRPKATLISSPAFLKRALDSLDLDGLGTRLATAFSSGGPLPAEVAASYGAHLDHPVVEVYGSTETGGIAYRSVRNVTEAVPWTVFPKIAVSLVEESGQLAIKSPYLMEAGWYATADLAELLPDGRLLLKGRADRIVKLEERRISLTEIEGRLAESPEVEAARVLALTGAEGERAILGAVVVPSEAGWGELTAGGKRALAERLRNTLKPFVESLALPRKWRFVRRLPATARGKTTNADLAALFEPGRGRTLWPRVLQRRLDGSELTLRVELEPDLLYFDGHFDVAPILAGVVQLEWAIRFAQDAFAISEHPQGIEALKFFRVLPAGSEVELNLLYDCDKKRLSFRYLTSDQDYSSGRVSFRAAP